ncbi:hypothetical protein Si046_01725 [Streptococcus infantarius subsp. infantarius]|nr:hypothetical protein [Streptococcus infantarius subsp. infantarius]
MRLNNKSHLLKTGLTTIQRNYSIINLLKSFYRLANLNLKFGKTEFKLELADISKNDIDIKNNVLTFKNPLTVKVDSQKEGELEILKASSGIVDKAVDVVTSDKKAMEFLDKKSQTAIYETSNDVMKQEKYQKKVAKYISQDLEQLLNLKSNDKISVKVNVSDLKFENIDPKE